MRLKQLSLKNYKNIEKATIGFSEKLNCIIGDNGMGKTNLLDSIYYLSFTRTNVYVPDNLVIRYGAEASIIEAKYEIEGNKKDELHIAIRQGRAKVIKRNKKSYSKLSEHIGLYPLVMVSPEDSDLILGGSVERRKFIDQIISQESNRYLASIIKYKKILEQRNSLLKQEFSLDLKVLSILDLQMAHEAAAIMRYRLDWLERIRPLFLKYYQIISDSTEIVDLSYTASLEPAGEHFSDEQFTSAWKQAFEKDRVLGYTSVGPHRDDLQMLLGEHLIRKVGSQGQNKTFLIALKFAQFALLNALHPNRRPLLLLDDVFDKLDEKRVSRIVQLVAGEEFGQIFMTDTNRKHLDQILEQLPEKKYRIFHCKEGQFTIADEAV